MSILNYLASPEKHNAEIVTFLNSNPKACIEEFGKCFNNGDVYKNLNVLRNLLILFSNFLAPKDPMKIVGLKNTWNSLTQDIKNFFHEKLLLCFRDAPDELWQQIIKAIVSLSRYDLPTQSWSDLMDSIISDSLPLKKQIIGIYICADLFDKEGIEENVMKNWLDRVLPQLTKDTNDKNMYKAQITAICSLLNYRGFCNNKVDNFLSIALTFNQNLDSKESFEKKIDILSSLCESYYSQLIGQGERISKFLLDANEKFLGEEETLKKLLYVWLSIGNTEANGNNQYRENIVKNSTQSLIQQMNKTSLKYAESSLEEDDEDENNSIVYLCQRIFEYIVLVNPQDGLNVICQGINSLYQADDKGKYCALNLIVSVLNAIDALLEKDEKIGNNAMEKFNGCFNILIQLHQSNQSDTIKIYLNRAICRWFDVYNEKIEIKQIELIYNKTKENSQSNNPKLVMSCLGIFSSIYDNFENDVMLNAICIDVVSCCFKFISVDDSDVRRKVMKVLLSIAEKSYSITDELKVKLCGEIFNRLVNFIKSNKSIDASEMILILGKIIGSLDIEICNNNNSFKIGDVLEAIKVCLNKTDTFDNAMKALCEIASVYGEQFSEYNKMIKDLLIGNLKDGNQLELIRETTSTIESLAIATRSGFIPIALDIMKALFQQLKNNDFPFKNKHFLVRAFSGIVKGLGFNNMVKSGCLNDLLNMINIITENVIKADYDLSDGVCFDFFYDLVSALLLFYSRVFIGSNISIKDYLQKPVLLIKRSYQLITSCPKVLEADDIFVNLSEFFWITSQLDYVKQNNDLLKYLIGDNIEILKSAYSNLPAEKATTVKRLLQFFKLI